MRCHLSPHSLENHGLDFGIVVDGICVGCIGGTLHNDIDVHNCELGYWLNLPMQ